MSEPANPPVVAAPASLAQCLWTFALLGPVFGYVTVITMMTVVTADSADDFLRFPVGLAMGALIGIPFAIFMGLVPAILIAIVYWALRAKAELRPVSAVALSAVAAFFVCAVAIVVMDGQLAGLRDASSWLMMVVPGVVATLLCAAVVERKG